MSAGMVGFLGLCLVMTLTPGLDAVGRGRRSGGVGLGIKVALDRP